MRKLGYSATWKTKCFLDTPCHRQVWAHTNGHGDFVLFDELGYPWPIHECYELRFAQPGSPEFGIAATKGIAYAVRVKRGWDEVKPIDPAHTGRQKRFEIVGTVTDVDIGIVGRMRRFRNAPAAAKAEVKRVLDGRNSVLTVVTGSGEEFSEVFFDSREMQVEVLDILAVKLRVRRLLSGFVFVITRCKVFSAGH